MKAYIYIISNRAIPDMVKISCSEEHPDTVVKYLDSTAATPFCFRLEYLAFLNDCYPILQAIRRDLWAQLRNVGAGWVYVSVAQAVGMIRNEVASRITDTYRQKIQENVGDNAFVIMMRSIDSVLPIYGDSPLSRTNDLKEALEISKYIVMIMRNENRHHKDRMLSIVAKKKHLSVMSKH